MKWCVGKILAGWADQVVGAIDDFITMGFHHTEGTGAVQSVIRGLEVQRYEGEP